MQLNILVLKIMCVSHLQKNNRGGGVCIHSKTLLTICLFKGLRIDTIKRRKKNPSSYLILKIAKVKKKKVMSQQTSEWQHTGHNHRRVSRDEHQNQQNLKALASSVSLNLYRHTRGPMNQNRFKYVSLCFIIVI